MVNYCIEILVYVGNLGITKLKEELDKINKENEEDYCYYDLTE